jgi:pimeloyl-ACP methyl ester carboxylesterase
MSTFVLIHGSTQNASCWDRVRPILGEQGHHSIAVELPHDRADLTASGFAELIVEAMRDAPHDCVVVAHSASGIFLPRIAAMRPVQSLVYLAAVIPEPGCNVIEQFEKDRSMLFPDWVSAGAQWSDPAKWHDLAEKFLFHDVLLSEREWAHSTIRPMRLDAAFRETFTGESFAPVRSVCAVANRDRTINPEWQRRVWLEKGPAIMPLLGTGHCPHVASPLETVMSIRVATNPERHDQIVQGMQNQRCQARAPQPYDGIVDYETFMRLDGNRRLMMFNAISAENRADLVRTHFHRWLMANRSTLSAAQIEALEEQLPIIQPGLYQQPKDAELERRSAEMLDRLYSLFPRDHPMWRWPMIGSQCIPEKKPDP